MRANDPRAMQNAIRPAGAMIETALTWVKSLADPLRSSAYADRWIVIPAWTMKPSKR